MARFSAAEESLIQGMADDRMRASLAQIRQAMEDIWAPDAPRIIHDYTDHGPQHCERIAGYAAKLLHDSAAKLSDAEKYLLVAGIYLHDIGMQCDVTNFPQIMAKAVELGAQFSGSFKGSTAGSFSLDQQKAIRANHHYLSIAWLHHAHRTGETVLGTAARTVPTNLLNDLADVCVHHTKLPITSCKVPLTLDPSGRKQFMAALLRFADELDIDATRVSFNTVKTFSMSPANSVYWWLHNATTIAFKSPHLLHIVVALHRDDLKKYGQLIQKLVITEFRTKNSPVLSVLAQNSLPIVIDDDSKVTEYAPAEPLPEFVKAELEAIQRRDPLLDLVEEMRLWLRALRYEVSDAKPYDSRSIDLLASLDQGTLKQRVRVRCIGGEISESDVETLDASLDRQIPQGWMICDQRISEGAMRRSACLESLDVFSLSDFLRQKIWGPYIQSLTSIVDKDRIDDLYVDLGCHKKHANSKSGEERTEKYASLDEAIDKWLTERGKMHISLLGEFGAGKTWFCRHYAFRQLEKYLRDPAGERLPLLITLRNFTKATTARELINNALSEQYQLPFVGTAFEVFNELNRRGRILLILDGFDEMAQKSDYQTIVNNFWELATLVDDSSKVILTSRTEYFRMAKEAETILGGEELGSQMHALRPPKFEVVYIDPFSDEQIRSVIRGRLGNGKGDAVSRQILKNANLADMARRPVLVELLLAALDEVNPHVLKSPAQVYLYATNKLLLRNIDTKRTFTTTADKLYFLCELAWSMIERGELRIHYSDIPERIQEHFGSRIKDKHELDNWDYDLRNQTLLRSNTAGYYEFAHKSLAEYFVALKFASELGCLSRVYSESYREASEAPCVLPFEKRSLTGLADTFGMKGFLDPNMKTVAGLIGEMVERHAIGRLRSVLSETSHRSYREVRYVGGNAVTVLRMLGDNLAGIGFSNMSVCGANLRDLDLRGASLDGCDMFEADLGLTLVTARRLSKAKLSKTRVAVLSAVEFKAIEDPSHFFERGVRGWPVAKGAAAKIDGVAISTITPTEVGEAVASALLVVRATIDEVTEIDDLVKRVRKQKGVLECAALGEGLVRLKDLIPDHVWAHIAEMV